MKKKAHIIRTTIVGGIFFLLPLTLVVILLAKAFVLLQGLLQPILKPIENLTFIGFGLQRIIAILVLLIICFIAGLVANTKMARRFVTWLEDTILGLVPGYHMLKSMGQAMAGLEQKEMEIVLARIDDGWSLSFLIEKVDEDLYTVYVPGAPNPLSGSVYHVGEKQIVRTDITQRQALTCLRQLGVGSISVLEKTKDLLAKHDSG